MWFTIDVENTDFLTDSQRSNIFEIILADECYLSMATKIYEISKIIVQDLPLFAKKDEALRISVNYYDGRYSVTCILSSRINGPFLIQAIPKSRVPRYRLMSETDRTKDMWTIVLGSLKSVADIEILEP